ncbi:uncharacterized protein JCM15063_005331 [Sporobolomyces koalae]|uniref:uncharacterized protein n=1 Tax=Sporobolomyces koalae TaxID=500713 RepID=UPI00317DB3A7
MPPPKGKSKSESTAKGASPSASAPPPPVRRKANIVKSGNAGSSKPTPPPLEPGQAAPPPPLFPLGYKTPLSLLSERCQKNGWERPSVDPKKGSTPGTWTASVTLKRKHPKSGEFETVYMKPPPAPSPIAVEKPNAMEAKHWASVYALYRFSNNLRLNLQLPPQVRDYYSALEKEKAASTPNKTWLWSLTPFETAAAAPPPSSISQAPSQASSTTTSQTSGSASASASTSRSTTPSKAALRGLVPSYQTDPRPVPKSWLEAPEVRMPTSLRDLVERTIRDALPSEDLDSTPQNDHSDDVEAPFSPEEIALETELVTTGFRIGHVHRGLKLSRATRTPHESLRNSVLSHLHLIVPESDLPAAYRGSKPADATIRNATSKDSTELGRVWKAEKIAKDVGTPVEWVENVMKMDGVEQSEDKVLDVLVRRLMGSEARDAGLSEDDLVAVWRQRQDLSEEEEEELRQRRSDELVGLEGMFGSRFRRLSQDGGCEILIPTSRTDKVSLKIVFHSASLYPSPTDTDDPSQLPHLPTFFVASPTLPPYIRLNLLSLLAQQFLPSSEAHGETWMELVRGGYGGVVGEMIAFLEEHVRQAIDHPPDERDVLARLRATSSRASTATEHDASRTIKAAQTQRKRQVRREPTAAEHASIKADFEKLCSTPGYQKMLDQRKRLPAWSMKEQIVSLIKRERVVIVCGETGSGKTTQVPAFVLEDAILNSLGASTSIVVTQPRRVSAIGVASRVANERCEDVNSATDRGLVGYAIRGERRASRDCRALFCTTGVVLARLSRGGDPDLEGVSHIFIDEVHERSVDSDFLLLELRDILVRNPKIRVVLMSATINQKQFSDYFGGAPVIEIPGFTHPVQDHYLESYLPRLLTDYKLSPTAKPARKATQAQIDRMHSSFIEEGVSERDVKALGTLENLSRAEKIDFNVLGATVAYCLDRSHDVGGDILVFVSGVMEITQSIAAIRAAVSPAVASALLVLPLHANLTTSEQTLVFRPTPAGKRKIVVATNVAETSITIDGIVYVVDSGRVKENTFDAETGVTRLVEQWTSRAAGRQRRGRAGRTRPGECFKLFTRYVDTNSMPAQPLPEIRRTPLESLLLQIKSTRPDADVRDYLGKALDPPQVKAIETAWATLRLLGAVEVKDGKQELAARLTPLGCHLAMIPVDLRLAKMLVLAAIFRCLDPILTIVALLSSKPFFLSPQDKREESKKARQAFYTSRSDLLSDAKAFEACLAAKKDGSAALRHFLDDNYISPSTFRDVLSLRNDYLSALGSVGFIPMHCSSTDPAFNENSQNENLLKAIIYAGTARLVKVKLPKATFDKGIGGAIERERESREVKFFEKEEGRVFLHPTSLLFSETRFVTPFATYFNKHVTTKPFLRDATEVPLYAVLLFSPGHVSMDLERGVTVHLSTDEWVHMKAWPRIGVLVNGLRKLFDDELERELEQPGFGGPVSAGALAMLECLSRDGSLH